MLFFCGGITAQEVNFNPFSLEVTTGLHAPLAPANIPRSNYIAFKQYQVAGRYMFTQKFGLKAHYAYNLFGDSENSNNGLKLNRLGLEGVLNLGKLLNVNYTIREKVGLLMHGGAGLTFAQSVSENSTDHMGNLILGLTGEIKLSNRFTLLGDITYVSNINQQYGFNGLPLNPNNDPEMGSFANISIGVMYSLGRKRHHADWY